MKLLNAEIEPLLNFLMEESLKGKQSRMRVRFCKLLQQQLRQIEEEKLEIIKRYANKNEDGSVAITTDENGKKIWDLKDVNGFKKEYKELMLEEFVLDNTEERKEMFITVKEIILNTEQEFKGHKALEYDRFCEIAETINYKEV